MSIFGRVKELVSKQPEQVPSRPAEFNPRFFRVSAIAVYSVVCLEGIFDAAFFGDYALEHADPAARIASTIVALAGVAMAAGSGYGAVDAILMEKPE